MSPALSNVRNLKVNAKLAGKACSRCHIELAFGENASICEACGTPHHQDCWIKNNGCAGIPPCSNAPPPTEELVTKTPVDTGVIECPACGNQQPGFRKYCSSCRTVFDPADLRRAPGALAAVICGCLALMLGGLIPAIIAIRQARKADDLIASDPTYTGAKMAQTGRVLAFVAIPLWIILLVISKS